MIWRTIRWINTSYDLSDPHCLEDSYYSLFRYNYSTYASVRKAKEYTVTWLHVIVKNAGFVSERFLIYFTLLFSLYYHYFCMQSTI